MAGARVVSREYFAKISLWIASIFAENLDSFTTIATEIILARLLVLRDVRSRRRVFSMESSTSAAKIQSFRFRNKTQLRSRSRGKSHLHQKRRETPNLERHAPHLTHSFLAEIYERWTSQQMFCSNACRTRSLNAALAGREGALKSLEITRGTLLREISENFRTRRPGFHREF